MKLSFPSPEFDDTVAGVCHGLANEPEMRALNELLRSNSSARDEYLMRVELHSRLASEPDLFVPAADAAASCRLPGISAGDRRNILSSNAAVPATRRKLAPALALAACLVFIAGVALTLWFKRSASKNGATSSAVAMLARAVDARWGGNSAPLRVGSALEPGWLRLEAGLAQVVFYSGARVVIEGPTELRLISATEAFCPAGRLLAEVPQPARGFHVKTAQINVTDRGTAFGIDATGTQTEVHVFKGEVELFGGTVAKQSLGERRAAVVQGNEPPRFMAASPEAFASMSELQTRSLAAEAIRYDQWRVTSARLNQDPSLAVHLDFENLSESGWTLRNAAAKNHLAPDATIVGCQRAEGRWREKQALEFQSVNDRVRLAVPGEFRALTLSAWVCVKGLDRQFNSLFMCDGFEPGTIHWLIRNDGVLGLTVFGSGPGNFQILASPPVLTVDKLGMWLHLALVLDGKTMQAVQYVNGSRVSLHTLKLGPPFRLGSAELGNWNARSGPNPAPTLIRNLSGSIDEFELFSRALSEAEVHKLYAEGKPESEL
jgi:Concanavalin A-like lectin/glucanases superfamily/FecR protein